MRRIVTALAILALAGLGGCVQFHSDLVLEKDGSGTMTMTFSMSEEMLEAMESMQDMPGGQGPDGPSADMLERDQLEKMAKHYGVKIQDYQDSVVDGRKTTKVVLAFDDYAKAACLMTSMSSDSEESLVLVKLASGDYALRNGTPDCPEPPAEMEAEAEESAAAEPGEADPEAMGKAMEAMGKMMAAMSEMELVMTVSVPGDVVSTNAHETDGHTVTWRINAENMMAMQGGFEPEVVFSGQGLKLKAAAE
jgi:hypothetical protein